MANLLATGAAFLSSKLQSIAATTITYSRVGETSATVTATVGQTRFEQDTQYGILNLVSRDYIFPVADLGSLGEPQRGDKITEGDEVYEVLSLNQGEPLFRYSDHGKTILRVRTKRITEA